MKTVDPFTQSTNSNKTSVNNGARSTNSAPSMTPEQILEGLQTVAAIFNSMQSMYAEFQHTERVRELEWTKQKEIQRQMNKDQFHHRERMAEIEQGMRKTNEISRALANTEKMLSPMREKANIMLEWVMNEDDNTRRSHFLSELTHFFNEINKLENHITKRLENL